jgi:DNA-3-methyladenine glycosylase
MSQKSKRLNKAFFERSAEEVAKELLGKILVRILPTGAKKEGIIIETEAYVGVKDRASHSFGGRRTKRNEIMYGEAGRIYVYFTYGMHWMLNFVVSGKNDPQAVLIRGLDNVSGPARLTKYLGIDKSFYGEDLTKSKRIWVEDAGNIVAKKDIQSLPRIGVNYARQWKNKKLRFLIRFTK